MKLVFIGGKEVVKLIINREKKALKIASSKTNYLLQKVPWKMLFDKGKESHQDKATENLPDDQFIAAIQIEMAKTGYRLMNKNGTT